MKILHTADIHLREYEDQRWKALEEILKKGKEEKVDLVVISGDLFNKDVDAEKLRLPIRKLFSNNSFDIVIIAGNHDVNSYQDYMDFGSNVKIMNNIKTPLKYRNVVIWGIPFKPGKDLEDMLMLLYSMKDDLKPENINILVIHCELILNRSFSEYDFGDEGKEKYMPVKLSFFDRLNLNYVLAGHFHSGFNSIKLKNGGFFVYPGSPVSITKKEIGRRAINLFETGSTPEAFYLDTPFYENIDIVLNPFDQKNPIEIVKKKLESIPPGAIPLITVKGFINGEKLGTDEKTLRKEIEKLIREKFVSFNEENFISEIYDVRRIIEDDLFVRFNKRLEEKEYLNKEKEDIRKIVIEAMIDGEKK